MDLASNILPGTRDIVQSVESEVENDNDLMRVIDTPAISVKASKIWIHTLSSVPQIVFVTAPPHVDFAETYAIIQSYMNEMHHIYHGIIVPYNDMRTEDGPRGRAQPLFMPPRPVAVKESSTATMQNMNPMEWLPAGDLDEASKSMDAHMSNFHFIAVTERIPSLPQWLIDAHDWPGDAPDVDTARKPLQKRITSPQAQSGTATGDNDRIGRSRSLISPESMTNTSLSSANDATHSPTLWYRLIYGSPGHDRSGVSAIEILPGAVICDIDLPSYQALQQYSLEVGQRSGCAPLPNIEVVAYEMGRTIATLHAANSNALGVQFVLAGAAIEPQALSSIGNRPSVNEVTTSSPGSKRQSPPASRAAKETNSAKKDTISAYSSYINMDNYPYASQLTPSDAELLPFEVIPHPDFRSAPAPSSPPPRYRHRSMSVPAAASAGADWGFWVTHLSEAGILDLSLPLASNEEFKKLVEAYFADECLPALRTEKIKLANRYVADRRDDFNGLSGLASDAFEAGYYDACVELELADEYIRAVKRRQGVLDAERAKELQATGQLDQGRDKSEFVTGEDVAKEASKGATFGFNAATGSFFRRGGGSDESTKRGKGRVVDRLGVGRGKDKRAIDTLKELLKDVQENAPQLLNSLRAMSAYESAVFFAGAFREDGAIDGDGGMAKRQLEKAQGCVDRAREMEEMMRVML